MSNVQIEQSKLDNLAMKVFAVSGEAPKHTVDEMAQILDYVAHHQVTPSGTLSISQNGQYDVTDYATADVNVPAPTPTIGSLTVTPSTSQQVFNSSSVDGYKPVTVNAMPIGVLEDQFDIGVENNIAISVSNSGLITASVEKTTSAAPVATSGYINSNSSIPVYIDGSKTQQLTTQAAQTIHPSSSDQTIASGRYLTGTQTIKAVTTTNLTAANIKSGVVVEVGDSTDSDCVTKITGTYSGGGSAKNIQVNSGSASVRTNGYTSTGHSLTVAKTGTYKVSWTAWRSSSQGTMGTNLHRNNTTGTNQQTWTNTYGQHIVLNNQSYTAGDVLTLYATAGSTSRYCWVAGLTIEEQ